MGSSDEISTDDTRVGFILDVGQLLGFRCLCLVLNPIWMLDYENLEDFRKF